MTIENLFANIGRKLNISAIYKPEHSISGLHAVGADGEDVKGKRTLLNATIRLTGGGDLWITGFCPDKRGPASFSTKEGGIKRILKVEWL